MSLQKNRVTMLAPDGGLAPTPEAEVIAANDARAYLIIWNLSDEDIALGLGGEAAVTNKGVVIPPSGFYEMINGRNLSEGAVRMISVSGGKAVSWQEGNLRAE